MALRSLVALVFLGVSVTGFAGKEKYVTFPKAKPVTLPLKKTAEVIIALDVKPGFHIQANPASLPSLIATTVEIVSAPGLEVSAPVYPPSQSYKMKTSGDEIAAYSGHVEIKVPVQRTEGKKIAKLEAKVRYQACNDTVCFFPTTEKVVIPVQGK